jgi:Ca2+/Na+ antiporter
MKTWKLFVLVNVGALVGIVGSLFIVPEATPIKLWGSIAALAILIVNAGIILRRRRQGGKSNGATLILYAGFLLFVLDVLFSQYLRHLR